MRLIASVPLVLSFFMASGIASSRSAPPTPAAPPGGEYVEVGAYLTRDADIETWYTAVSRLKQNFDDICGDTFCEGDYSNIQSLSFRCSVEKLTGVVGRCSGYSRPATRRSAQATAAFSSTRITGAAAVRLRGSPGSMTC